MRQRVQTQNREPDQPSGFYEELVQTYKREQEERSTGAVVIRAKELEWEVARQGKLRWFSHMRFWHKLAAPGWHIFEQDIIRHSGKHVHQGGLGIFVKEGKGYSVVDGVRYDWEGGDLIVLPIKPGGCEHQHFNLEEGESCKWIAFVYRPFSDCMGDSLNQREVSPDWKPS